MSDTESGEGQGVFWTLQQFWIGPTGKPWLALHKQNDEGVQRSITGYGHELDVFCRKHGITPRELEPITETEYYRRMEADMPEPPAATIRTPGRVIWDPN